MKKVSITWAKNNLSALIDGLRNGSPVLIVDRDRPVARLEPVAPSRNGDDGRLERLVRAGLVRPGRGKPPRRLFTEAPPPGRPGGLSILDALIEERREGR